jgi:hypothetical protein
MADFVAKVSELEPGELSAFSRLPSWFEPPPTSSVI